MVWLDPSAGPADQIAGSPRKIGGGRCLPFRWIALAGFGPWILNIGIDCFLASSPCCPEGVLGGCRFASSRRCDVVNTCSRPALARGFEETKKSHPP